MGGIVGRASGDGALVENCWMAGGIVSTHPGSLFSGPDLGGIVGIADRITITGCIHMGDIQAVGQSALIGGICGHGSGEITGRFALRAPVCDGAPVLAAGNLA